MRSSFLYSRDDCVRARAPLLAIGIDDRIKPEAPSRCSSAVMAEIATVAIHAMLRDLVMRGIQQKGEYERNIGGNFTCLSQ